MMIKLNASFTEKVCSQPQFQTAQIGDSKVTNRKVATSVASKGGTREGAVPLHSDSAGNTKNT